MAAVLAAGEGAVLSHRSAAMLWGIRDSARSRIDVTAAKGVHSRSGISIHEAVLPADEVTAKDGVPVTTPPRTLLDLAAVAPRAVERAINEAEVLRLTDHLSLADLVARHPGRRGVAAIRRVLDAGVAGATVTRSRLERAFLEFLDRAGLPRPEVNAHLEISGTLTEVDVVWRSARLIVELDGFAAHGTRRAFERDRARDRALQAAGWRVIRITWRQLHERPDVLAAELRALLAARPRSAEQPDEDPLGALEVLADDPRGRRHVAPLQRPEELGVLGVGAVEHRCGVGDVGDQLAHLALHLGHRRQQPRGAGRLGDAEVEEDVGAPVDGEVGHLAHGLDVLVQAGELGRPGALGGEHHGADLDRDPVVEQLAPVAALELDAGALGQRRRRRDERAAATPAGGDQVPALGQRGQGLAQRRAGDAELVGQVALGRQPRAGLQQSQPDRRAEALDGLLEGGRGLDRLEDRGDGR
jgi:hypothetical protein